MDVQLQETRIDKLLKQYCNSVSNIKNGDIGPTTDASTNYYFGSSQTADASTEYFLVSKRAVMILGEQTLKGEYLYTVVCFFETAGYKVESVEIAFFLNNHTAGSFSLKEITGVKFLENYLVFNSTKKWVTTDLGFADDVTRYELTLTRKTHY